MTSHLTKQCKIGEPNYSNFPLFKYNNFTFSRKSVPFLLFLTKTSRPDIHNTSHVIQKFWRFSLIRRIHLLHYPLTYCHASRQGGLCLLVIPYRICRLTRNIKLKSQYRWSLYIKKRCTEREKLANEIMWISHQCFNNAICFTKYSLHWRNTLFYI